MQNESVLEAIMAGATICYAPVSGGLILLKKGGERAEVQPTMEEFLEFRSQNKIKHVGTMRQGHHIFHGRVDFYKSE